MFYKLMYRRSLRRYMKSYINILCIFILSLSMLSFTNIYCDSYYNYYDAVLIPMITEDHTCDIRVKNITEEQAELFYDIPYVEMKYIDGNLDFFLTDTAQFENVHMNYIVKIFNRYIFDNTYTDTSPAINVFYGSDARDSIDGYYDNGARFGTALFQMILSVIGIAAMSLIYSDYISRRTGDIRTFSALGITGRQLNRLFFGECSVLYMLSAVIGIPIGGLIAFLFFKVCGVADMSRTNAIYPVFDLDIISLIITAAAGFIVIFITYRIVLAKILKIDASYTCMEAVMDFDPDRSRGFYARSDRHFDIFFASVLQKRGSSKSKVLVILTSFVIALSIFMLNAVCYSAAVGNSYGVKDEASAAAVISNSSLFIMIIVYALLYSLSIVNVFMKRQMESNADAVRILYALGADENAVYYGFRLYTLRRIIITEVGGFGLGYAVTAVVFSTMGYGNYMSLWFLLGNIALAAVYYFVYMHSMKKYFNINCRNSIAGWEGEQNVTA